MGVQADRNGIVLFLTKAKKLLSTGNYDFVPRRKNMQALAQHGLTFADAKSEILELTAGDYYKGPKKDFDLNHPGDIWEFKKEIEGSKFYIKLKIENQNGRELLKCLSFHEDDFI